MTRRVAWPVLALVTGWAACRPGTARLDADQEARLTAQGIVLRADDLTFRRTRGAGGRDARWQDRTASIVVTHQTVLIHQNGYVELLIEPTSRRALEVHRDGDRVRINAGSAGSAEVWSFAPPDDAEAWAQAIRAVIQGSRSIANPRVSTPDQ